MILIISSVVLVISIFLLLLSNHKRISVKTENRLEFLGFVGIVFSVIFGFILFGAKFPVSETKTEIKDYDILEGKHHLVLDMKEDVEVIEEISVYRIIDDNRPFKVYKIVDKNSYGEDIDTKYVLEPIKE